MSSSLNKCDSCGKESDVLVPVKILVETPWGYEMQTRHFCPRCFTILMETHIEDDEEKAKTFIYSLNVDYK